MSIAEKLTQIAENEQKVYDAGIEEGKKSEYDLFWDTFQSNGNRRYYEYAFADDTNGGRKWISGKTYRPKYPMKPLAASYMFRRSGLGYEDIAKIDFSECKNFDYAFYRYGGSQIFPPIDLRSATSLSNVFNDSTSIKEMEKIKVSENTPYNNTFSGCTGLREVRFEGTIGQNGLNFKDSTLLSRNSIETIIEALSTTASGKTLTLSKAAVDKAYETSEGANDGSNSPTWLDDKLAYRPNWTISLA